MARAKSKKPWSYSRVGSSSHGLMQCHVCGKQITEGEYRHRATYKHFEHTGFVTGHRDCTTDDPMWVEIDAKRVAAEERRRTFIKACIDFKKKWGVDELDDYIPDSVLRELEQGGEL